MSLIYDAKLWKEWKCLITPPKKRRPIKKRFFFILLLRAFRGWTLDASSKYDYFLTLHWCRRSRHFIRIRRFGLPTEWFQLAEVTRKWRIQKRPLSYSKCSKLLLMPWKINGILYFLQTMTMEAYVFFFNSIKDKLDELLFNFFCFKGRMYLHM